MTASGLRRFKRLPVYVVEDHCHVLKDIYRNIGAKYLPFEGNTLVHFDSHPDLLLDKDLRESVCWEKERLFESLSIENWILPGCYTGQFSKVLWIKPSWTQQIPEGFHNILVGEYGGNVRVGSPLFYFISDGIFVDKDFLKNRREFQLGVFEWPNKDICLKEADIILDIDLDFFSTQNPFLSLFEKGRLMERIDKMFTLCYDINEERSYREYVQLSQKRCEHLNHLELLFQYMANHSNLDDFDEDVPDELLKQMEEIINIVDVYYDRENFDWQLLFNAGMTCDMIPLPHHVSTNDEITASLEHFEVFLKKLQCPPVMVTIARSSNDEYCPKNQVDFIQSSVLTMLEKIYGEIDVHKNYDEEIGCSLPEGSDC